MAHALAPIAEAQSDGASDGDARTLFAQARADYEAQRFEEAARAFRRAYLLSPRYALLYNIGQSELRAGHDALALEAFEGFLRQAPQNNVNRAEVEERARVLHSMGVTAAASPASQAAPLPTLATTEATPAVVRANDQATLPATTLPATTPPATTPPATTPPEVTRPVASESTTLDVPPQRAEVGPGAAPWIIFGGGGAALITGAVLMGLGVSSAADVSGAPDGSHWADLESVASGATTMWVVGTALAGVGLAAAAVGLVWVLTGSRSSSSDEATARLRVSPMGIGVEGEF